MNMGVRRYVVRFGIAVCFLSVAQFAEACGCAGPFPTSAAVRAADAVFVGSLERLVERRWSRGNADGSISGATSSGYLTATFKVEHVFRGDVSASVALGGSGSDCDHSFTEGERWLVFASQHGGKLTTDKCTRTRLMGNAAEDLKYLENLAQGRPQAIIFGNVHHQELDAKGGIVRRAVSESLEVIAMASGQRFSVTTEPSGAYQLVLPPGAFEVWVERRGGRVSSPVRIDVSENDERRVMLVARHVE
jgi:hypothetical protein